MFRDLIRLLSLCLAVSVSVCLCFDLLLLFLFLRDLLPRVFFFRIGFSDWRDREREASLLTEEIVCCVCLLWGSDLYREGFFLRRIQAELLLLLLDVLKRVRSFVVGGKTKHTVSVFVLLHVLQFALCSGSVLIEEVCTPLRSSPWRLLAPPSP